MAKRISLNAIKRVKKQQYILEKLAKSKSRDRKKMLMNAPNQLFSVFKTLCQMVMDGQLQLGRAQRHQKTVEKLSKTPIRSIKANAKQQGGIFGSIIAGVLPFLGPIIKGLLQ